VAALLGSHDGQRGVRSIEQPEHVDVDHAPPVLRIGAHDGAEQHHAGVVDQDVESAPLRLRLFHHSVGLHLVRDVGRDGQHRAAASLNARGQFFKAIGPSRGHGHARAVERQRFSGGLSDARRGARDQRCFAV